MALTSAITHDALNQFYGSENWYRHPFRNMIMTDGTYFLSENGAASLIDAIASYQGAALDKKCGGFQLWKLVKTGNSAVLTCQSDSNTPNLVMQKIPYTDFPLDEIKLYVEGEGQQRVCLLTSEH